MLHFLPRGLAKFFRDPKHWEQLAFFRSVPLFHGLSSKELARVVSAMQRRVYQAGEVIFSEGQLGKAVFIIKSGQVELTRNLPRGGQRSLAVIGSGHIFGEMALLENMQRTASAAVLEDGEIYLLYTATLDSLITKNPAIGVKLMRNMAVMLSGLLRKTNREMDQQMKAS